MKRMKLVRKISFLEFWRKKNRNVRKLSFVEVVEGKKKFGDKSKLHFPVVGWSAHLAATQSNNKHHHTWDVTHETYWVSHFTAS